MSEIDSIKQFAEQLADASAKAILPHFRSAMAVSNKSESGFDPVTVADREAERVIRALITEHRSADGIIGEEFGEIASSSGLSWILDPIDGTRAFISGFPLWGTLIAAHDGHESLCGVMNQPYIGERFIGDRSHSQLRCANGKVVELACRACSAIEQATLVCTSPDIFSEAELTKFNRVQRQVAMCRFGGDCYGYCMLAAGHVDLVIEAGLQSYDIQALIPIVTGAGGVITDWQGNPVTGGGAVVASGDARLHEEALSLLA